MKLSNKEIKHIANLARLELTEKELDKYGKQLSDVLGYIDQLQGVDTIGVEPTAQVTGLTNVFNEDKVCAWDKNEVSEALKQAPDIEKNQVKVKRVLE
ncbi:Asp-tRNA(Asn)/Glu-tRNA(Gln) amidotransferase subunit GatC [Candidatus Parcubacteria bacterium]|nr:Asp-tRNA(Asn)/Glu-tRNA(Gln) amidotransferase subunit GatC [Candidatus Parcubacteria bacterium]